MRDITDENARQWLFEIKLLNSLLRPILRQAKGSRDEILRAFLAQLRGSLVAGNVEAVRAAWAALHVGALTDVEARRDLLVRLTDDGERLKADSDRLNDRKVQRAAAASLGSATVRRRADQRRARIIAAVKAYRQRHPDQSLSSTAKNLKLRRKQQSAVAFEQEVRRALRQQKT